MIDKIWNRIIENEGFEFRQIRGGIFSYRINANSILLDRTNRAISKSEFKKALRYVPLKNTVSVQHLQAPSYIYAILMDPRIRKDDW